MKHSILLTLMLGFFLSGCVLETSNVPVAKNDTMVVHTGETVALEILENDYAKRGTLAMQSICICSSPSHGTLEIEKNRVIYHADANYEGNVEFSYSVEDTYGVVSNKATVYLTVKATAPKRKTALSNDDRRSWYVQFSVTNTDTTQRFSGMKLGVLDEVNASKRYSLKAFGGFAYPYLNVASVDAEEKLKGTFSTFYKPYTTESTELKWRFKVRSSEDDASLMLQWNGIHVLKAYTDTEGRKRFKSHMKAEHLLLTHMKLIDESTNQEVPALREGKFNRYSFTMDGETERWFTWVLSDENVEESTYVTESILRKSETEETKKQKVTERIYDPSLPPFVKEIRE